MVQLAHQRAAQASAEHILDLGPGEPGTEIPPGVEHLPDHEVAQHRAHVDRVHVGFRRQQPVAFLGSPIVEREIMKGRRAGIASEDGHRNPPS
jgi:hypothetical protein